MLNPSIRDEPVIIASHRIGKAKHAVVANRDGQALAIPFIEASPSGNPLIDFHFSDDKICLHSPDPYQNREEIKPLSLNYWLAV